MKLFKKKNSVENQSQVIKREVLNQIAHQRGNTEKEYPSDFSAMEVDAIKQVRAYTMTSVERLVTLYRAIDYLEENDIPGDVVECGVWKGGSMMLAASRLVERNNTSRKLYLFDTYEGMSEPTESDKTFDNLSANDLLSVEEKSDKVDNVWCYSTIEEVKRNLSLTNYNLNNIVFVKGKVEDTLPHDEIDKIALLRLDTDWYESTKYELDMLYDKLVIGGVLIIDDYGHWSGAKKAVDEFIKRRNLKLHLTRIDYTGRLAIKLN